ncbi:MAG: hypothetical protein QM680_14100 [Luteolibacter sp.]
MLKSFLHFSLLLVFAMLTACGGSSPQPSPFQNNNGKRKSSGNAEIEGPGANDLIHQSRQQYNREKYPRRSYYGY